MKYLKKWNKLNENQNQKEVEDAIYSCFGELIDDGKVDIYESWLDVDTIEGWRIYIEQQINKEYGEIIQENPSDLEQIIKIQQDRIEKSKDFLNTLEDIQVGIKRMRELENQVDVSIELDGNAVYVVFKTK